MALPKRRGIPAGAWFARQSFHAFVTDPATGPKLDAMLQDNARVDAEIEAAREHDVDDSRDGERCGRACGYCGRCS